MTVGSIVAKLQLDLTDFRVGLERANSLIEQSTAQAERAGVALGAIGAAVTGAFAVGVKDAASFEELMRHVNTTLGASEEEFGKLTDEILKMAGSTGHAPEELAKGMYVIASSGLEGAKGLQVLEESARASVAGMANLEDVVKTFTGTLMAYGMQADQIGYVSDVLYKTSQRAKMSFGDLAANMGEIVSAAARAKLSLEEVGAALTVMTRAGIIPAEAFTSLNRLIMSMIRPQEKAIAAARQLGIEWGATALTTKGLVGVMSEMGKALKVTAGDMESMQQAGMSDAQMMEEVRKRAGLTMEQLTALFPEIRALRGALALAANDGQNFALEFQRMKDTAGATATGFAEQSKAISVAWSKAWETIRSTMITAGLSILPLLTRLPAALQSLAQGALALQKHAPAVATVTVAVVALTGAMLSLTAAYVLYQTHVASTIVVSRQLLGSVLETVRGLATANVTLAAVGTSAGTVAGAFKALWAAITGPTLWRAGVWTGAVVGMVALGAAAMQADDELRRLDDELLNLIDRAGKVRAALPVQELQALRPSWLQMVSTKLGEMFGLQATEGVRLYREQVAMAAGEVERAEERATKAKEVRAQTDQQLQSAEQKALEQRIATILKERDERIKAGGDTTREEQRAQMLIAQARAETHKAELEAQSELLAAQGRTHEAELLRIQAEAEEKRKTWAQDMGETKAREEAALWAHAKRIELIRTEARERTRVMEQAGQDILTRWGSLTDVMYQQGRVKTAEYVAQMKSMLDLIDQINAARRAAGEGDILGEQRLQILVKLRQQELDTVQKLKDLETKLAQDRISWAQEELRQRQQVGSYELQMTELVFQHRRDLQTLTNNEDKWAFARIAQDELALLQQKRQEQTLDAETRLQYLEREKQLIMEMAQSGAMPASQAKEALDQVFGAATEARQEIQQREQEVWAQRQAEHEKTLAEITTQQKTLRDQLKATTQQFGTSITETLKRIESGLLAALRSIQVQGAKSAAVGPGHGGNQYVFYIQGRPVTANMDAAELAEQLAAMLETQYAYRRQ
ncbi:MAG: phage tail tape measure protein [Armatimonadota bacterium]